MVDADLTAPLGERASTMRGGAGGPDLRPGSSLGRYVVVERLGAGSGGTVYAAFDSHLSRKVAIKVLRSSADDDVGLSASLLREAQLIAALDHPNIVTVHDIGQSGGHTFIAMELVSGSDFAAWLRRNPPHGGAWKQRLAPWLLAGRGLAAAHRGGVIHGDFKPANVLLGDARADAIVRVSDFGVARLRESDRSEASGDDEAAPPEQRLWGTPMYMAPELFDGRAPDERSDVYSYCVSVHEALYGFAPGNGEIVLVQAKPSVPPRVLEILRRGLRAEPSQRTASVTAVVDALERATRSRRGRWLAVAGIAAVAIAIAIVAALAFESDERRCERADARLAGVWDAPRRAEAKLAFDASGLPYAETAWRRFSARVDQYAAAWVTTYAEVCEQHDALLDAKMACLARRRAGLLALVDGVAQGSASRIGKSGEAADGLSPLQTCVELEQRSDSPVPPAEIASDVARIDELLAAAQIGMNLDDLVEAEKVATEALATAEAAGFRPLVARAEWALGRAKNGIGEYADAAELLEHAAFLAEEVGDDETAAEAGLALMYTLGVGLDDSKAALAWAPHVEVALKRGHAEARLWSLFYDSQSIALRDLGRREEAAAATEGAIDAWRQIDSDLAPGEIAEREAELLHLRGDIDGAVAKQREAARLIEETVGWPHAAAVVAAGVLADYLQEQGDVDQAIAVYERVLDGIHGSLGVDHPFAFGMAANLADGLSAAGRFEEALDLFAYARDGFARTTGTEHPRYAGVIANMAATLGQAGRHEEALQWAERAIDPIAAHFGDEHRITGYVYGTLGTARRRSGDPAGAIEPLERALAIQLGQGDAEESGEIQFELAKALIDIGGDRDRAVRLALAAQKSWHEAGRSEDVAAVAQWVQEHQ